MNLPKSKKVHTFSSNLLTWRCEKCKKCECVNFHAFTLFTVPTPFGCISHHTFPPTQAIKERHHGGSSTSGRWSREEEDQAIRKPLPPILEDMDSLSLNDYEFTTEFRPVKDSKGVEETREVALSVTKANTTINLDKDLNVHQLRKLVWKLGVTKGNLNIHINSPRNLGT